MADELGRLSTLTVKIDTSLHRRVSVASAFLGIPIRELIASGITREIAARSEGNENLRGVMSALEP